MVENPPSAAETIARLGDVVPRGQEVVDRVAGPYVALEQQGRRRFRNFLLALFVIFWALVLFAPTGIAAGAGGFVGVVLVIAGVIYLLALRPTSGHAVELVRNGVARVGKVEALAGGSRTGESYAITWTDLQGGAHREVLSQQNMPKLAGDVAVLVHPQRFVAAIVVGDWLCVV